MQKAMASATAALEGTARSTSACCHKDVRRLPCRLQVEKHGLQALALGDQMADEELALVFVQSKVDLHLATQELDRGHVELAWLA